MVEAPLASRSVDPFQLTEKDRYIYGRGVLDMKGEDTALLTALVRMKREGFKPDRDIVAAFTADEEAGTADGVQWLLKTHPDLLSAGLAINPEGAAGLRDVKRVCSAADVVLAAHFNQWRTAKHVACCAVV